ncbi:helix-turn-helix transcriptional regulator [Streptomyces sp. B1866]|uniref:helix-turn-helix domain-containing protein n=1 Tax=Streptomyces sp. B1866 TaxID=3075431 RepID=UPI0028904445|nr:helix-turn-helix transcriptional regulator [Streptomyces sp. B1866]MDT3398411.1 helix-turn-helix transcriptional regulator [Streptomyces sp. B1866]
MTSPPTSVQQARRALGQRLRELRKDAGLTARELARRAGWHESKCSRLEHGRTQPSDDDIRAWTLHCDALEQTADLIAVARGIHGMYVEWRRLERSGLKQVQESVVPLWERTQRYRIYSSWLIPGPVQTRGYIAALLSAIRDRRNLADDVDAAVQVRMDKQHVVHDGHRRFAILLEESVLRYRIGDPETMTGQLEHLLSAMSLPSISLGVIPLNADRSRLWPVEGFFLYDNEQVNVELTSAHLTVTQPNEIIMYARTFSQLADLAVYGAEARALVNSAIKALG